MPNYLYLLFCLLILQLICSCTPNNNPSISDKEKIEVLKEKAEHYYNNDYYKEALNILDELIEKDSTNGDYFYKRGYCKAFLSDFENSTKDYLKATELGYNKELTYYTIGLNHENLSNDSMALKFFDLVLEINPNHTFAKGSKRGILNKLNDSGAKHSSTIL
ncbi:MAG: hypothetical protein H0X62_17645 [Bacteroidetes bacterium]|nr:hypothetical protein [Bacteroidota bacterium]